MRRIVADTNIYISAFNFGGIPNQILDLGRDRSVEVIVCRPILNEIERVLRQKFSWSLDRIKDALNDIDEFAETVDLLQRVTVIEKHDADNRILECALAAGADNIVSGDAHVLDLGSFRGILILSPREFIETIRSALA